MCKPCTPKCKCKINCNNPHNNGGTCDKCKVDTTVTNTNHEIPNINNDDNNDDNNDNNETDDNHDEDGDNPDEDQ